MTLSSLWFRGWPSCRRCGAASRLPRCALPPRTSFRSARQTQRSWLTTPQRTQPLSLSRNTVLSRGDALRCCACWRAVLFHCVSRIACLRCALAAVRTSGGEHCSPPTPVPYFEVRVTLSLGMLVAVLLPLPLRAAASDKCTHVFPPVPVAICGRHFGPCQTPHTPHSWRRYFGALPAVAMLLCQFMRLCCPATPRGRTAPH